jgi:hypothetical protein
MFTGSWHRRIPFAPREAIKSFRCVLMFVGEQMKTIHIKLNFANTEQERYASNYASRMRYMRAALMSHSVNHHC